MANPKTFFLDKTTLYHIIILSYYSDCIWSGMNLNTAADAYRHRFLLHLPSDAAGNLIAFADGEVVAGHQSQGFQDIVQPFFVKKTVGIC